MEVFQVLIVANIALPDVDFWVNGAPDSVIETVTGSQWVVLAIVKLVGNFL